MSNLSKAYKGENYLMHSKFSFFDKPIQNVTPCKSLTLPEVYDLIRGNEYKTQTQQLRQLPDKQQARQFKAQNFYYVTFSGVFSKRNNLRLLHHSGLLVLDFDNLTNIAEVREALLNDSEIETELLFQSPSGNGLKWVVAIDLSIATHLQYFEGIKIYLLKNYELEIDNSGKDVARACFLCYDPNIYINPKYLDNDI